MTRRVEKLYTKKFALISWPLLLTKKTLEIDLVFFGAWGWGSEFGAPLPPKSPFFVRQGPKGFPQKGCP